MEDRNSKINIRARRVSMYALTLAQKKEVMEDINEVGLVLLDFYISKNGLKSYTYDDDIVGYALSWKNTKVKDYRQKLVKYGYFKQTKTKNANVVHIETEIGHIRWKK